MWMNGKKVDILGALRAAEKPARRFGRVEKLQRVIREVAMELDAEAGLGNREMEDQTIAERLLRAVIAETEVPL